jgi:hypothetical protein
MQGKKGTLHECTHLNKWGHLYNVIFLLQVYDFLGEALHCSQDLFGRASGRFIIRLLSFSSHKPLGLQPCYPHFLGITRRSCLEAHKS